MQIDSSLHCQYNSYRDRISFSTDIMKNKVCKTGEQHLYNNIIILIKQGSFDIIYDISENFTLVILMDNFGNVKHAVSIVIYWIF